VAEEVRTTFSSVDEIRLGPKLNSCVYLRACIDETLRLAPPGGATFWRVVETGGTSIGGTFIPEGCEVGVGTYIMHHHPSYWDKPFSFTPERWLEDRGASKAPYFPFNIGNRGCVGKPLAIAQLMLSFARLLWEFDFRRAETDQSLDLNDAQSSDDERFEEYVLRDHIVGQANGPIMYLRACCQGQ
jgi:cytochrome P450